MHYIIISPKAKKELKNISKLYRKAVRVAFDDLAQDPYLGKPLTRELAGRFSYKIGVYRIIYKVNKKDKIIFVLSAGHRSRVYK